MTNDLIQRIAEAMHVPAYMLTGEYRSVPEIEESLRSFERSQRHLMDRIDRRVIRPAILRLRRKIHPRASRGWRRHVRAAKATTRGTR